MKIEKDMSIQKHRKIGQNSGVKLLQQRNEDLSTTFTQHC